MGAMRPRRKPQPKPETVEAAAPLAAQPAPPAPQREATSASASRRKRGLGDRLYREMLWFDNFLRRTLLRVMVIGTHIVLVLATCYAIVWAVARGHTFDTVEQTPLRLCGLVLGTVPKVDGRDNAYFTSRIQAAADLYHGKRLQYLIVSGNADHEGYNEPSEMKTALIGKGVPSNRIYCDSGGSRTLDSVVRAGVVFGQERFVIISQAFQSTRALYIARRKGLVDCVAYNAPTAGGAGFMVYLGEVFARVWAILDVEFLRTEPKVLGNRVEVGEKHPPVD